MAKILKTTEQEAALKKIIDNLAQIKILNALLNAEKAAFMISSGRTKFAPRYEKVEVDEIVLNIRKPLAAEVRSLSKKYSIGLDDSDFAILENTMNESKRAAAEKELEGETAETPDEKAVAESPSEMEVPEILEEAEDEEYPNRENGFEGEMVETSLFHFGDDGY